MKVKATSDQVILELLEASFPDSSRRTLRNWLAAGRFTIDGQPVYKANHQVLKGQELKIGSRNQEKECPIPILYEDEHLVVINKPAGLLSVPLDKDTSPNVLMILREHYETNEVFAVHRIDKDTSGVLVFARSQRAREGMDLLFHNHTLTREYHAIVEGNMQAKKGSWKNYLVESAPHKVRSTKNPKEGKVAITHYEVVSVMKNTSFLRLTLETGRKHQIRVHCQEAGHPILGDKRYGSSNNHYKRLCLHAHRLEFVHPITKKRVDVQAPTIGFMKHVRANPKG